MYYRVGNEIIGIQCDFAKIKIHSRNGMKNAKYKIKFIILIMAALFFGDAIRDFMQPKFRAPHIKSSPYVAPPGCSPGPIRVHGTIPQACLDERDRIGFSRQFGFPQSHGSLGYYRVGNDGIEVTCLFFNGNCRILNVVTGVFRQ
jgi:hypothetical protein